MKKSFVALIALCMMFKVNAARLAYIINGSSEPISVKGPTKATNKVVIPVTLKTGEMVAKNIDMEGLTSDTLDLIVAGTTSQALKKYQRKYPKTTVILVQDDEANGLGLLQTDTLSPATVTNATSF